MLIYSIATEIDYDDFFRMKSDYNNIAWGGFIQKPDNINFKIWYLKQIDSSSNRKIYIVKKESESVGYFNLEEVEENTLEISIGVLTEFSGIGIGAYMISSALTLAEGKRIIAWIAEDNIASIKSFKKNSFIKSDDRQIRDLPLLGGEHVFYKWVK